MEPDRRQEPDATKRDNQLVPIHVRFVPKDIWIRLHIDPRSTIGAVKDAVLEKIKMPPFDPTLLPGFYDEARYAMIRPALVSNEARAFPKAFLARTPKRTVGDVIDAEESKTKSQPILETIKSSPNKFNTKLKAKGSLTLARELIGGDPGEGGMGSLGYVGSVSSLRLPNRSQESIAGDTCRKGDFSRLISSPSSSSTAASKLINGVRAVRSPRLRASMTSLGAAAQDLKYNDLLYDPTVEAGLDAYVDYPHISLPGNAVAKQKEEEAMLLANASTSTSGEVENTSAGSLKKDGTILRSSPSNSSSFKAPSSTSHTDKNDLELGDSSTDDGSHLSHDHGAASQNLLSSESDTSRLSQSHNSQPSPLRSTIERHLDINKTSPGDIRSKIYKRPSIERARSGTLVAVQDPRLTSFGMARAASDLSSRPSNHVSSVTLGKQSQSSTSLPDEAKEQRHMEGTPTKTNKRGIAEDMFTQSRIRSKIAGIQLDEISAWKDAQHSLSKFFCVYSYSNGHLLEDWRTVAAFRLRPFELLEIQYSDPQERIRLPKGMVEIGSSNRPFSQSHFDMDSLDNYIAPCCQGWSYIFKRNSGNSKAQRAGLGVWKLRYITIRGPYLIIYRKKPQHPANTDLQGAMMWNINSIDCVFSEQADGFTRPALMALDGLSTDILTLTISAEAAPPAFLNNENSIWATSSIVSLSMRFISQLDSCAFFQTFARATIISSQSDTSRRGVSINEWRKKVAIRATIAGRGGSVFPGKAGRNRGRNAIARTRMRPPGVSRDFDDVDRWSSHSESEEYDKVKSSKSFNYSDLYGAKASNQVDKDSPFFDPSYDLRPFTTITSLKTLEPLSPREDHPAPDLSTYGEQIPERQRTLSSEVSSKPGGGDSMKAGRSRGFSFAKIARKAISPSDLSSNNQTMRLPLVSTPIKKTFGVDDSIKMNNENSMVTSKRRSTQPDLAKSNQQRSDTIPSGISTFVSSDTILNTQTHQASRQSNSNRHSQQMSSTPTTSFKGRHRSYTLSSFTSSSSSSSPTNFKRSNNSKVPSSSGNGPNQYSFHWPFRSTNARAATNPLNIDATDRSSSATVIDRGV